MKIMQVGPIPVEHGGKTFGGVASHLWDLSINLARSGNEVAIIADNFRAAKAFPEMKAYIQVYGISRKFALKKAYKGILKPNKLFKALRYLSGKMHPNVIAANIVIHMAAFEYFKPDVIHVHHLTYRLPFSYIASDGKVPIISTVHSLTAIKDESIDKRAKIVSLIKKNTKKCKNIIFVSEKVKAEFAGYFQNTMSNVYVVTNPVSIEKYKRVEKSVAQKKLGIKTNVPILLFVGSIDRNKGVYELVNAIKMINEDGRKVLLLMVGDGEEFKNLQEYIKRVSLSDTITMVGRREFQEILTYYSAADLFVLPSHSEGFSLVYIEAMACGLPVVGIKNVADESIPNESVGLLAQNTEPEILKNTIINALNKSWDKTIIINHAKKNDWRLKVSTYEKIYEEISLKKKWDNQSA